MPLKRPPSAHHSGLLPSNPILVQALGLCPALAVTTSLFNAVGLASVTLAVLLGSCLLASLLRRLTAGPLRLPSCVVLITTLVTIAELLLQAGQPRLARELGPFLPLVVVNCLILGRILAFASKAQPLPSLLDAARQGLGFALVLVLIAVIRELLGDGSLTLGNEQLWPEVRPLSWGPLKLSLHQGQVFTPLHHAGPLRLLHLPAGALILLAYLSGLARSRLERQQLQQLRSMNT